MKKIAFVSDFDGTMSKKDLYKIIIDKYLGQDGWEMYNEWKKTKKINVDFLNKIFSSVNLTEEAWLEEILNIPVDESALSFINEAKDHGWSFYVLSAGTSYYIDILFKHLKVDNIKVISMDGKFEDGHVIITPDKDSVYYSDVFGIDKGKFIDHLKKEYDLVLFAGDSEPDLTAAKSADYAFCKTNLNELMISENANPILFEDFSQIKDFIANRGWFV